jgi:hypothetical protein
MTANTSIETAQPSRPSRPSRKGVLWTSRILSALPVLLLAFSASMKLSHSPQIVEGFVGKYGYPEGSLLVIGLLELACTAVYVIPRTSVLGAILLTGYLGGAIATHVRAGEPFVVPLLAGILVWVGLYLREDRLRGLVPLRK